VDPVRAERFLDQGRHPLRVDHVGGKEGLHRPGDLADRVLVLAAERCRQLGGDLVEAFGAEVHRAQQVALRPAHLGGHLQFLGPLSLFLGFDAELVDLRLDVQRRLARGARQCREQRFGDLCFGFLDDFAGLVVVVLQALGLLRFQAAVDQQHDQDQQHHRDAGRDSPAHHQGVLVVTRWAARTGGAPRPRAARRARCAGSAPRRAG